MKQIPETNPRILVTDKETGEPHDISILEETGVAYDPTRTTLDLSKAEKLRTTALMMAINAYSNLIIKDAEYLKEMHNEARRENGPVIRPATMDAMVEAAINFEAFLLGRFSRQETPKTATESEQASDI